MSDKFFSASSPTSNAVDQAIRDMDWEEPEKYRIEWESKEKWTFDSAYAVKEFRYGEGARAMMLLVGPRGGEYLIDSNPNAKPLVRKEGSDGYERKDRLAEITIFSEDFNWRHRVLRMMQEAKDRVSEES